MMTATRKSNQIKNLLLLLSREKEKNRKGRRRDPHLFSFFTRRDCGWVWGEEGISFRFERASSKLLLENSVIFDDVSKAMTSLSLSLSLRHKNKNKKNVWVFSFIFRQKMRRKKHKLNFTSFFFFTKTIQITADSSRGYLLSLRQIPQIRGHQGGDRSWPGWRVRSVPGRSRHPRLLQGH